MRSMTHRSARLLVSASLAALLTLYAAGCTDGFKSDITGSVSTPDQPRSEAEWRREMEVAGARYRADQADVEAAIRYAQALRAIGQRTQAAAVLEQAAIHNPENKALL